MVITQLVIDNLKPIKAIQIRPDGTLVKISGKNGQGKTSVLDAIWLAFKGMLAKNPPKDSVKGAVPRDPRTLIRNGTEEMKIFVDLKEIRITRWMTRTGGTLKLKVENADGTEIADPQEFLNALLGELTFDPLVFMRSDTKTQIATLRKVIKVDAAFEQLDAQEKEYYDRRREVKIEADVLESQLQGMVEIPNLPKHRIDDAPIRTKIAAAAEENRKAQEVFSAKNDLGLKVARIEQERTSANADLKRLETQIANLQESVKNAKADLKDIEARHKKAQSEFDKAPEGKFVDVAELNHKLEEVQITNRNIEERDRINKIREQIEAKQKVARDLNLAIDAIRVRRKVVVANADMPVEGLSFDENEGIKYKNMPLENYGEAEQIRISTLIAMAGNPKIKIVCIRNGEAFDSDGLKVLSKLAKDHGFQIWMTIVNSTGEIGIVLEDGMVKSVNHEEEDD